MRDLVKNCLRMRPDRIIVGEARGPEAFDLLQAMNTGHDGSMSTIHSNSPRECISRMESMILMGGYNLPAKTIREMIVSGRHHHPGSASARRHPQDHPCHRGGRPRGRDRHLARPDGL
jgi:Flp pilus assembly CpaF family ATPase